MRTYAVAVGLSLLGSLGGLLTASTFLLLGDGLRVKLIPWLISYAVGTLLGVEAVATLPSALRLVVFDTHLLDVPAADVCIGVPTHVEKSGHWVNVDGIVGKLDVARAAPHNVEPLTRTVERLAKRVLAARPIPRGVFQP